MFGRETLDTSQAPPIEPDEVPEGLARAAADAHADGDELAGLAEHSGVGDADRGRGKDGVGAGVGD